MQTEEKNKYKDEIKSELKFKATRKYTNSNDVK